MINPLELLAKKYNKPVRFIIVGLWNTFLGYTSFVVLYYLFSREKSHYLAAMIVSQFICILNAYLCYKYYVFKTSGLSFQEPARFVSVYALNFLANLLVLPFLVDGCHMHPIAAQGIIVLATIGVSYVLHNRFSFRTGPGSTKI